MARFLTRQEIIDKLQSLPDLPVVYRLDSDALMSSGIQNIEVIDCAKGYYYNEDQEYESRKCYKFDYETTEKVIWIS